MQDFYVVESIFFPRWVLAFLSLALWQREAALLPTLPVSEEPPQRRAVEWGRGHRSRCSA